MKNNNLDNFINIVIKLIENSEKYNKEQILFLKEQINKQEKKYSSIKKEIDLFKTELKISNNKFSLKSRFIVALTTALLTGSMILIKFKSEIFNYFK